ncbi:MAG: hypothetical protein Rubg2KO_38860 [Rubricoccaceae bacterium]
MSQQVSIRTPRVHLSVRGAFSEAEDGLVVRSPGGEAVDLQSEAPVERLGLAEETTYTVWAESLSGKPVEICHADPVMTAALRRENDGQIMTGTLRFGSHVGRSRFVVIVGEHVELEIVAVVAPRKVTWEAVQALRDEVDAAWAGLPLAALRPTHDRHQSDPGEGSAPAWLALLRASADALDTALHEIGRRPIREVDRTRQRVRASRITRADSTTRASVRRAGGGIPEVVEARLPRLTLDTSSHRWLASRVRRVLVRLQHLMRDEVARPATDRRRRVLEDLEAHRRHLGRHLARGPLAEIAGGAPSVPPLALRRRPAYATAYDALRQLDGSLVRADGEVRPSLLDLAGLYEAWCALTLVRETAHVLDVEAPIAPFGLHRAGVDVRLRRGHGAAVRLEGRGVQVDITYSPRFASPQALLAQRPDLLFTVQGRATRRVVFDAKYRREETAARYGVAGPPADAIGALHRYRDAILGPDGTSGWIDSAIALYPPASDLASYETSRLWVGLAEIGVGAIPLVPGQTEWLRQWIERTIRGH